MGSGRKLFLTVFLFLLYALSIFAGNLLFGGDSNYPPYEYIDESGNITGFNVELARAIAKVTGLEIEIRLDEWGKIRSDFDDGKLDGLLGMAVTPQRAEQFDFSVPHNTLYMTLFFRKGTKKPDSESDLHNKAIVVQRGGVMHDYLLEKHITDQIITVEAPLEGLKLLSKGVGYYGIFGKYQALYLIKEYNLKNLAFSDWVIYERDYAFAVQKDNVALLNKLNKGLLLLIKNGEYNKLYEKWFGPLDWKAVYGGRIVKILYYAFVILALVTLLIFFWSWFLKKKVKQRTLDLNEKLKENRILKEKAERLHDIALQMEKCKTEEEVYDLIVNAARSILSFDVYSLDILEGEELVVKRKSPEIDCPLRAPKDKGIAGKTLLTSKTIMIDDIKSTPEARPVNDKIKSAISVPIGEYGIFQTISYGPYAFTKYDVRMAELLALHAAEAIRRIRVQKRERYLAFHDSLTGLYNRAFLEEELNRLDTERNLPISIIFIDVNMLKTVNDTYGHFTGDNYLKEIAKAIKESCRHEDLVVRWGGDEFVILLIKTEREKAKEIVKRIEMKLTKINHFPVQVSVAAGAATKTLPSEDIQQILREAEKNMYENKRLFKVQLQKTKTSDEA